VRRSRKKRKKKREGDVWEEKKGTSLQESALWRKEREGNLKKQKHAKRAAGDLGRKEKLLNSKGSTIKHDKKSR